MGSSDFFSRKSLLPAGKLEKRSSLGVPSFSGAPSVPAGRRETVIAPEKPQVSSAIEKEELDIFQRPTVVPELPLDQHARALMRETPPPSAGGDDEPGSSDSLEFELTVAVADALPVLHSDTPEPDEHSRITRPGSVELALNFAQLAAETPDAALALVDNNPQEPEPASLRGRAVDTSERPTDAGKQHEQAASVSDLYSLGDYTGALAQAELRLKRDPNDKLAGVYRKRCQEVLIKMWSTRLGSLDRRVRLAVTPDEVRWLSVDHKVGFFISLIEGEPTLDEIIDMSAMPTLDALRILAELVERGVIEVVR